MESLYVDLCKTIISVLKTNDPNISLKEINFQEDFVYIENLFLNKFIYSRFSMATQEDWLRSMKYVSLKFLSFFDNRMGDLKYIYNIADELYKEKILDKYKKLVEKLYVNKIVSGFMKASKNQINKNDNMNIKITELLNNINNYKEPAFMATIIDIFFYDTDVRDEILNLIKTHFPFIDINIDIENINYIETMCDGIKELMNIHVGTVKLTKNLSDYIGMYISELFNKSIFLNKTILRFVSDSESKFECKCKMKLYSNIKDCGEFDIKSIRYVENSNYKPLHIKAHIKHIVLKLINCIIFIYRNNSLNVFKENIEEYAQNPNIKEEIRKIINLIRPNSSNDIISIITNIIENKKELQNLYINHKDLFLDMISEYIGKIDMTNQQKEYLNTNIKNFLNNINFNDIPDINDEQFIESLNIFEHYYNKIKTNLKNLSNLSNKYKYKKI